jgi:hypothetical protein
MASGMSGAAPVGNFHPDLDLDLDLAALGILDKQIDATGLLEFMLSLP